MSDKTKSQKISFFSAMLIVVGGTIGAGIFFVSKQVNGYSQGSLLLAIFCWILAACAIVAMGLALIEIASVRNDNLSLIGWNKVFNSRFIYKGSKNFMVYIYLPLTYFFMPFYVIASFQEGLGAFGNNKFGTEVDWIIWLVISLAMSAYFIIVPAIWSKVGDIQNKAILSVKFIPLALVAILGLALLFSGKSNGFPIKTDSLEISESIKLGESIKTWTGMGAGLGLFLAIAAIFFSFDAFYVAAGISSEMKEPKKTPLAILMGIVVITVVYLLIAIAISVNGGTVSEMTKNLAKLLGKKASDIILGILNLCIAFGILGIINSYSMWSARYVEDLYADGDLPFWQKFYKKLNPNKPWVGVKFGLIIALPISALFVTIGAVAYRGGLIWDDEYGSGMNYVYGFCDLMATWTALFTFAFIAFAIFGAIKNRKTNKIEIKEKKAYFMPCAWIAVIATMLALGVTLLVPFIDLFILAGFDENTKAPALVAAAQDAVEKAKNDPEKLQKAQEALKALVDGNNGLDAARTFFKETLFSRLSIIVVLFIFLGLTFLPTIFEDLMAKKKFGSVAKYEAWKAEQLSK
ncbi:APC family permease [Mycoplasma phocoenae]|uniref:APC family permease n=1 Tax=Mycoplasma phocoenae TaxID=754517 RepID=A0A858U4I9_9MOLU|nr:APC family permease [Mycoplasma phocoenae]QJG66951.1 APC family permease [Mycoplasma phocoenae]